MLARFIIRKFPFDNVDSTCASQTSFLPAATLYSVSCLGFIRKGRVCIRNSAKSTASAYIFVENFASNFSLAQDKGGTCERSRSRRFLARFRLQTVSRRQLGDAIKDTQRGASWTE